MELMIASGKAVPKLQLEHGLAVDRVYTGSFMTSLDMAGLDLERSSTWLNVMKMFSALSFFRFLDFHHESRSSYFAIFGCSNQGSCLACWCWWSVLFSNILPSLTFEIYSSSNTHIHMHILNLAHEYKPVYVSMLPPNRTYILQNPGRKNWKFLYLIPFVELSSCPCR